MKTFSALLFYILCISESHAYLDPGTGSILIQGLVAGIAAAALVIKTYWHRVKSLFGRGQSIDIDDDGSASKQTEQQDTG